MSLTHKTTVEVRVLSHKTTIEVRVLSHKTTVEVRGEARTSRSSAATIRTAEKPDLGWRARGYGLWFVVWGLGFMVWGLGLVRKVVGFRFSGVQSNLSHQAQRAVAARGLGFMVYGLGFRVQGSGFMV